jgi:hypothetical protein
VTEAIVVTCAQQNCQVAKDGKCLEGLQINDCPHYGKPASEETTPKLPTPTNTRLGEGLSILDAESLLAACDAQVVVIAGNSNSGKTTLVTTIYETFLVGEFAGHRFAGSRTLFGFEQRNYKNRGGYGFEEPDTPHTPFSNPSPFLHLRLQPTNEFSPAEDLLLVDVSGERFSRAGDTPQSVAEIAGIARADALVLLLDGELLASPATRQQVISSGRQVLAACLGANGCGATTAVHLVVAKLDLLEGNEDARLFVEKKVAELAQFCSALGHKPIAHYIAARSKHAETPTRQGLEGLLQSWLRSTRSPPGSTNDPTTLRRFVYGGDKP